MTVQCEGCRRYRVDGQWTRLDAEPVADFVGHCPTCAAVWKRAQARRWAREGLELLRRRAQGYGADPDDVDWEGLRRGQ